MNRVYSVLRSFVMTKIVSLLHHAVCRSNAVWSDSYRVESGTRELLGG